MNFDFSFLQQIGFTPLEAPLSQDEIILFESLNIMEHTRFAMQDAHICIF